jgi:hypothetical protein
MHQELHQKAVRKVHLLQVLQNKHWERNPAAAEASCRHMAQGSLCHSPGSRRAPRWMVGQLERAEL